MKLLKYFIVAAIGYFFARIFQWSIVCFPVYKNFALIAIISIFSVILIIFIRSKDKSKRLFVFLVAFFPFFGYVIPPARFWIHVFYVIIPIIFLFLTKSDIFRKYHFQKIFVLLFCASLIATLFGIDALHSARYVYLNIGFFLFFCFIVKNINTIEDVNKLIDIFIIPYSMIIMIGLFEWIFRYNFAYYGQGSLSNISAVPGGYFFRTVGTFLEPLSFAEFIGLGMPLVMYKIVLSKTFRSKILYYVLFFISFVVLLSTISRTSLIAATLSVIIFYILSRKNIIKMIFVTVTITFLLLTSYFVSSQINYFKSGSVIERLKKIDRDFNNTRLRYWKSSFKIAKDYPQGIGFDNYKKIILTYDTNARFFSPLSTYYNIMAHPESGYLIILYEYGWFGFLVVLCLIINSFFRLKNVFINYKTPDTHFLALALMCCIFFIAFNLITTFNYRDLGIAANYWLILALIESLIAIHIKS
jgi:O-antigen ligase